MKEDLYVVPVAATDAALEVPATFVTALDGATIGAALEEAGA